MYVSQSGFIEFPTVMALAWQAPFALYIQSAALQLETSGISMTSFFIVNASVFFALIDYMEHGGCQRSSVTGHIDQMLPIESFSQSQALAR
jgi:hypothetical protein